MLKKIKLLVFIFLLTFSEVIFSESNDYKFSLVKSILVGKNDGELGYTKPIGGNINKPSYIAFDEQIYIADSVNNRVLIYDKEFNYVKSIKENSIWGSSFAYKLIVFKDSITYFDLATGLGNVSFDGKTNYLFKYQTLPEDVVRKDSFFNFNQYCLYYNSSSKSSYYNLIDEKGSLIVDDEASSLIYDLIQPYNDNIKKELNNIAIKYMKQEQTIIHNDKILSVRYLDHRNYNLYLKSNFSNGTLLNLTDNKEDITQFSKSDFICFDKLGNSYWKRYHKNGMYLIILTNLGSILDVVNFSLEDSTQMDFVGVSSNGSMIFMKLNDKKTSFDFYKLEMND